MGRLRQKSGVPEDIRRTIHVQAKKRGRRGIIAPKSVMLRFFLLLSSIIVVVSGLKCFTNDGKSSGTGWHDCNKPWPFQATEADFPNYPKDKLNQRCCFRTGIDSFDDTGHRFLYNIAHCANLGCRGGQGLRDLQKYLFNKLKGTFRYFQDEVDDVMLPQVCEDRNLCNRLSGERRTFCAKNPLGEEEKLNISACENGWRYCGTLTVHSFSGWDTERVCIDHIQVRSGKTCAKRARLRYSLEKKVQPSDVVRCALCSEDGCNEQKLHCSKHHFGEEDKAIIAPCPSRQNRCCGTISVESPTGTRTTRNCIRANTCKSDAVCASHMTRIWNKKKYLGPADTVHCQLCSGHGCNAPGLQKAPDDSAKAKSVNFGKGSDSKNYGKKRDVSGLKCLTSDGKFSDVGWHDCSEPWDLLATETDVPADYPKDKLNQRCCFKARIDALDTATDRRTLYRIAHCANLGCEGSVEPLRNFLFKKLRATYTYFENMPDDVEHIHICHNNACNKPAGEYRRFCAHNPLGEEHKMTISACPQQWQWCGTLTVHAWSGTRTERVCIDQSQTGDEGTCAKRARSRFNMEKKLEPDEKVFCEICNTDGCNERKLHCAKHHYGEEHKSIIAPCPSRKDGCCGIVSIQSTTGTITARNCIKLDNCASEAVCAANMKARNRKLFPGSAPAGAVHCQLCPDNGCNAHGSESSEGTTDGNKAGNKEEICVAVIITVLCLL